MRVYNLKEFGLQLKAILEKERNSKTAMKIANEIEKATHPDGASLTPVEKGHILKYIRLPGYDHVTGRSKVYKSDNSEFLKLVAIVTNNISNAK